MRGVLLVLVSSLAAASSFAQPVRAVTESGDRVVLFADGPWAPDDGTTVLPAIRDGQRQASEWFRYAVWAPEGWTTMNAVDAYYDGEIAFVPGGNRDSVVVTMEYIPMESTPMEEGEARQRVVERYVELFGQRFPTEERFVAGHRVTTLRMTEADPRHASLMSAVTAPGGAVLINVHVEGTRAPIDAIASRFLQGVEIERGDDPSAFLRDPCEVYMPLKSGFALDVPEGWDVKSTEGMNVFDIELAEQTLLPDREPAVAFVITADLESDESRGLSELAEALVTEFLDVEEDEGEWNVYSFGPWPPGSPVERADRTYLSPDGEAVLDVSVVRGPNQVALAAVAASNSSAMRYGLGELVNGVRICQ